MRYFFASQGAKTGVRTDEDFGNAEWRKKDHKKT